MNKKVNKTNADLKDSNVPYQEGDMRDSKYWNRMYLIVFLFLALQIVFYYFITKYFN